MAPTLVVPLNVLVNERRLYLALGRHDMAITAFAQVLAERPEMIDVHYSLGRALQVVGRDAIPGAPRHKPAPKFGRK